MRYSYSIAIEGLACCGKSTLIEHLSRTIPGAERVSEIASPSIYHLPISDNLEDLLHGHDRFSHNDRLKSRMLANRSAFAGLCLLDRYYISTLAHRIAQMQQVSSLNTEEISYLLDQMEAKHLRPTLWVYLRTAPVGAWQRYAQLRVVDTSSQ